MLSSLRADGAPVMCLNKLNEDVLRSIFQYLYGKDLWSLSLSNKALAVIAEPFLYRRIDWDWTIEHTPPIISFLNAILRRPSLGTHLRVLNLTGEASQSDFWGDRLPLISTKALDRDTATLVLAKTRLSFHPIWMKDVTKGCMDALLALLLLYTPKLTHLLLGRTWSKWPRWLCRIIAAGLDNVYNVPKLEQLVEVSHQWHRIDRITMRGEYTIALLVFFYMPHIRQFTVTLDYPTKLCWPAQPPACTSLVSLRLLHVRESQLLTLLSATPNLRHLQWEMCYHSYHEHKGHTRFFNLDQLMTALRFFENTLESLTLVIFFRGETAYEREMETIGSARGLSGFKRLKDIRIPISFMDDFRREQYSFSSIMPSSIERLVVSEDLFLQTSWRTNDDAIINALEFMLESWRVSYPQLQSIEIIAKNMTDAWQVQKRKRVLDLGNIYGVEVHVNVVRGW